MDEYVTKVGFLLVASRQPAQSFTLSRHFTTPKLLRDQKKIKTVSFARTGKRGGKLAVRKEVNGRYGRTIRMCVPADVQVPSLQPPRHPTIRIMGPLAPSLGREIECVKSDPRPSYKYDRSNGTFDMTTVFHLGQSWIHKDSSRNFIALYKVDMKLALENLDFLPVARDLIPDQTLTRSPTQHNNSSRDKYLCGYSTYMEVDLMIPKQLLIRTFHESSQDEERREPKGGGGGGCGERGRSWMGGTLSPNLPFPLSQPIQYGSCGKREGDRAPQYHYVGTHLELM
ncbi:uncharacterized protein H6S33_003062 [Morchella sextelata]|uniref:uncharacterized protein n=1 Tax=Morchella sextelata TaxID=1174677 RepID=UPI001D056624|nr:uncharacterized protein H6S33_003062 [Morchella sextelata]KAH0607074.1 hypothetical protein H6S33_003062 [Morchella sextelata]